MPDPTANPSTEPLTPVASLPSSRPAEPAEPAPRWRQIEARSRSGRRRLRAGAVLGLLVIGLALAGLATWYQPIRRPTLIVLTGPTSGFEGRPEVAADRTGLRRLVAFDHLGPPSAEPARGPALILGAPTDGPLVVYLAARVRMAGPGPSSRVQFDAADGSALIDLLGALLRQPAQARLLILDAAPPTDDPRAGGPDPDEMLVALHDQVAAWLREQAGPISTSEPLAILLSTEPGQRPVESAALGQSVFGYYVADGLRGSADSNGDGRITARELAAFARDRVDRYVQRVFGSRQSPVAYGLVDADFTLVAAPRRLAAPEELAKDAPAYPDWLTRLWRERDGLVAAGAARQAPRPFAQFEAAVLGADRAWRGGLDAGPVRANLTRVVEPLRERIAATRDLPRPPARSLAQAFANGEAPTAEATRRAVAQALARRPPPKPDSKPGEAEAAEAQALAQFFEPLPAESPASPPLARFRSPLDLAGAVVGVAAAEVTPTPGAIAFLDRLLGPARPAFSETATLRNLARHPADWQPDQARRWIRLVLDGERLQAEPINLLGDRRTVVDATRLIHEARVVVEAPRFAAPGEVDRRLNAARVVVDAGLAHLTTLRAARDLADDATRLLPASVPLLADDPELERTWLAAAEVASVILDRLDQLDRPGSADRLEVAGEPPVDLTELADRVDQLRESLAPLGSPKLAARVAAASRREPLPGPAELEEARTLLATPLPTAEGRAALWDTAIATERRLVAEVLKLDASAGRTITPAAFVEVEAEAVSTNRAETTATRRRSRIAERLLLLGGAIAAGSVPDSGEAIDASIPTTALTSRPAANLGPNLPDAIARRPGSVADRLARLVAPWLAAPSIDAPDLDLTRRRRIAEFGVLRRYLAARYAFEARDASGSEFAAEAARDFEDPTDPPMPQLAIDIDAPVSTLESAHPEVVLAVTLRPIGAARVGTTRSEVTASDSPWLALSPGLPWPDGSTPRPDEAVGPLRFGLDLSGGVTTVPIRVRLCDDGDLNSGAIPPGVLLRTRFADRTAHRLVPLAIEPASYRPRVVLTADPAGTGPELSEVRLRVLQGKVPLFLSVRNPSDHDRRVVAELADRRGPVSSKPVELSIPAGGSARLGFGPPTIKPEEGFREIRGPLVVRLTDPTGLTAPVTRTIPVGRADPTRYVQARATFEPARIREGGRSLLSVRLRAVGPIVGPPCPVELSLTPGRIPGLLSPGEGTYSGTLAKVGDEVTLTAEGVEVDRLLAGDGRIDLTLDGLVRALVLLVPFDARTAVPATPVARPSVGLQISPVVRPGTPVRVGLVIDSPPEDGRVVVELGLPNRDGGFDATSRREVDSLRGQVRLNPTGPDGALVFEAAAEAPAATIDVGAIRGLRLVQAQLFDEAERKLGTASVALTIDDRPPVGVEFITVPKYGLKGGTVLLRARAARIPAAGFREVVFFVGRPADGKRPAGVEVVQGRPDGIDGTTWTAKVPLGETKLGTAPVAVEFVTGVGLNQFATASLEVVEVIPPEPATIRGMVVVEERPQPKFEVILRDEKGVEKRRVQTNQAGQYEMTGVAPGTYRIYSSQATPPLVGSDSVTVVAGDTKVVKIPLYKP